MALERTLSIIKPDAVAKNSIGKILDRFEEAGLRIEEGLVDLGESQRGRQGLEVADVGGDPGDRPSQLGPPGQGEAPSTRSGSGGVPAWRCQTGLPSRSFASWPA